MPLRGLPPRWADERQWYLRVSFDRGMKDDAAGSGVAIEVRPAGISVCWRKGSEESSKGEVEEEASAANDLQRRKDSPEAWEELILGPLPLGTVSSLAAEFRANELAFELISWLVRTPVAQRHELTSQRIEELLSASRK